MTEADAHPGGWATPRLRRLVRSPVSAPVHAPAPEDPERCELCGTPVPEEHRHLLDVEQRRPLCACPACSILFDRREAGGRRYLRIPDRVRRLDGFVLDDGLWASLGVPVGLAFFLHDTPSGRVTACYPGPMGATGSQPDPEAWAALAAGNPVLAEMEPDVEALLVNRVRGAREHWLVPVDACYRLAGHFRTRWRGPGGGAELWDAVGGFFDGLRRRAVRARP